MKVLRPLSISIHLSTPLLIGHFHDGINGIILDEITRATLYPFQTLDANIVNYGGPQLSHQNKMLTSNSNHSQ